MVWLIGLGTVSSMVFLWYLWYTVRHLRCPRCTRRFYEVIPTEDLSRWYRCTKCGNWSSLIDIWIYNLK